MGNRKIYKRIISLILLAFFVTACGSINTPPPSAITLNTPSSAGSLNTLKPTTATMPVSPAQPPTILPGSPSATSVATAASTSILAAATLPLNTPRLPAVVPTAGGVPSERRDSSNMQIRIKTEDKVITATLNDSETARDFISLLPLSFTLEDYAGTEKIFYLPQKLTTKGAPAGSDPSGGDIAYYSPWGNLAIYYKDFGYSNGLVILGKIDNGLEALTVAGPVKVTVELDD